MKGRIQKLESDMEEVRRDQVRTDKEIAGFREFRHSANGTLHSQNGKLSVIEIQQNSTADAIAHLTTVVQDAIKKLNAIMTVKSMCLGGGVVFVPTVTGMVWLFKMYLESKGYK